MNLIASLLRRIGALFFAPQPEPRPVPVPVRLRRN